MYFWEIVNIPLWKKVLNDLKGLDLGKLLKNLKVNF